MYPVFVLMNDSGEVLRFDSLKMMTNWMEPVDVANSEYSAWSINGEPLQLQCTLDFDNWLVVGVGQASTGSLSDALGGVRATMWHCFSCTRRSELF